MTLIAVKGRCPHCQREDMSGLLRRHELQGRQYQKALRFIRQIGSCSVPGKQYQAANDLMAELEAMANRAASDWPGAHPETPEKE